MAQVWLKSEEWNVVKFLAAVGGTLTAAQVYIVYTILVP